MQLTIAEQCHCEYSVVTLNEGRSWVWAAIV